MSESIIGAEGEQRPLSPSTNHESLLPTDDVRNSVEGVLNGIEEELPIEDQIEQAQAELDMMGGYLKSILTARLEDFGKKIKDGLNVANPDYKVLDDLAHEFKQDLDKVEESVREKIMTKRFMEDIPADCLAAAVRYDMRREELEIFREKFTHDFCNTPLNAIVGFLDILAQKKNLTPDKIQMNHELIDLAVGTYPTFLKRITLLADQPKFGVVPGKRILDIEREVMAGRAASKGVKLSIEIDDDFSCYSDKGRVDAILRNLVNNAIKFTATGGEIKVSVKNEDNKIVFKISDTGRGISAENYDNFRELFDRNNNPDKFLGKIKSHAGTSGEKGTGKGMITCRRSADDVLGEISVQTEKGKGTTFTLSIPGEKKEILARQMKFRMQKEAVYKEKLAIRRKELEEKEALWREEELEKKKEEARKKAIETELGKLNDGIWEKQSAKVEDEIGAAKAKLEARKLARDISEQEHNIGDKNEALMIKKALISSMIEDEVVSSRDVPGDLNKSKKPVMLVGGLAVFPHKAPRTFAAIQPLVEYAKANEIKLTEKDFLSKDLLALISVCVEHATSSKASIDDLQRLNDAVAKFLAEKNS